MTKGVSKCDVKSRLGIESAIKASIKSRLGDTRSSDELSTGPGSNNEYKIDSF